MWDDQTREAFQNLNCCRLIVFDRYWRFLPVITHPRRLLQRAGRAEATRRSWCCKCLDGGHSVAFYKWTRAVVTSSGKPPLTQERQPFQTWRTGTGEKEETGKGKRVTCQNYSAHVVHFTFPLSHH